MVLLLLLGVGAFADDEAPAPGSPGPPGPKAAELLLELKSAPWQRRGRLELDLAAAKDPALLPGLIGALADPEQSYRVSVARILGATGDPRAVDPLIGALADPDPGVQRIAADALGKLGDPRAAEPLARLIERVITSFSERPVPAAERAGGAVGGDDPLGPAIVAGTVLRTMGDSRGRDTLIRLMREGPPARRRAAVIVVRNLYDPLIVFPLIDLLRSEDADVRLAALDFLVWKRPMEPDTREAIAALLRDPDARVRDGAARALAQVGDQRGAEALQAQEPQRGGAAPVGAPAVSLAPGQSGERPAGPALPPSYLPLFRDRIAAAWAPPRASGRAAATVALRANREGAVVKAELASRSGDPAFDQAALLAVERLAGLPPLPPGREYLDVVVRFEGR